MRTETLTLATCALLFMMGSRIISFLVVGWMLLTNSLVLFSQTGMELRSELYVGVGIHSDVDKARESATNNLLQQIQVFVSSTSTRIVQEENANLQDTFRIQTVARSSLMLRDVKETVTKFPEGTFKVTKSVSKDVVRELFAQRRTKILSYIEQAKNELANTKTQGLNLESALKHYYRAWLLASIHPDTVGCTINGVFSFVTETAPREIETIVHGISFVPLKEVTDETMTWKYRAMFRGQPVSRLRFEYMDGIGQSVGEVVNGETQLSFFFVDKEQRERELVAEIDYRYEEELDELLAFADSMQQGRTISSTLLFKLPGKKNQLEEPLQTNHIVEQTISAALQKLLDTRGDLKMFLNELKTLVKGKEIITGNRDDFDSLEGLYGVVISDEEVLAIVLCTNHRFLDVETTQEAEMSTFNGRKIIWIEVLK
ncbi:MAG: hypothetical protein HYZ34_03825 [Ignavibacteriae bacterium]|nr:hypothetical protein [Ignavibacteriota bacterium]